MPNSEKDVSSELSSKLKDKVENKTEDKQQPPVLTENQNAPITPQVYQKMLGR